MRHRGQVAALALALACALAGPVLGEEGCTTYGAGVSVAEVTPVATILAEPDAHAGKTVRVEGEVAAVCQQMGCWMEIVAGEGAETLRVKVEDGEIAFPVSARGQRAVAQGTVEVREMSRQEYEGWRRHLAEEQGEELDPAALPEGPYRLVQVRGTGAEICG